MTIRFPFWFLASVQFLLAVVFPLSLGTFFLIGAGILIFCIGILDSNRHRNS